jgi:hypothetical protein
VKRWHLIPTPAGYRWTLIGLPTMRRILGLAIVALVAIACSTPAILTPPVGPNTDYPCGDYTSQDCGDGTCCYCEKCFCNQYGGCTDSTQYPTYDAKRQSLRRAKP